jgi:predicted permease
MHTFPILAPVFLLVFLGWLLRRTGFMTQEFARGMTKLAFFVALPCLLFVKIAPPPEVGSPSAAGHITLVVLGAMVSCVVVGYLTCRLFSIQGRSVGAYVQAAFRGNLAYVGLPVALYVLEGAGTADVMGWERTTVLALAPVIPSYNIVAVLVLLAGRERISVGAVGRLVGRALSNPLVIACALGAVFSYGRLTAPTFAFRAATSLGDMGMPLALLSIGASLNRDGMTRSGVPALLAALTKVAWAPFAGLLIARALGLGPEETRIALILCACPTAVASYIMAAHYESDEELAAGAVMISTLLSAVSLALVIALV